jgi:pantetheine-phosphate adenylyltransferase
MSKVLIPGSFDPITNGHLDIIERASILFDEVVVLISHNSSKNYMLCMNSRKTLAEDAVRHLINVKVDDYDGLLADYVNENKIDAVVKGIRNEKDYTYENDMALSNEMLSQKMYSKPFETVYIPSKKQTSDISSTVVRILLAKNADISSLVPNEDLLKKLLAK